MKSKAKDKPVNKIAINKTTKRAKEEKDYIWI
jgi:hypothetical protein